MSIFRLRADKPVKFLLILSLMAQAASGQTGTASIQGTLLDGKTLKPVPAALVIAVRAGPPPFTKKHKIGWGRRVPNSGTYGG